MTREELEPIAEVVKEHDLYVISDEIYGELTYKGGHTSIASLPGMKERTLVINGFSKVCHDRMETWLYADLASLWIRC